MSYPVVWFDLFDAKIIRKDLARFFANPCPDYLMGRECRQQLAKNGFADDLASFKMIWRAFAQTINNARLDEKIFHDVLSFKQ